jgi:glycosyltransferase involved in cell wall biosynthesis
MNVLIVAGIFPPDIGGPADFTLRFARYLVGKGHTVTLLCWSDVTQFDPDRELGFRVVRIPRVRSTLLRAADTLRALLRAGRYADVWFVNGLPAFAALAAARLGKPAVVKVVGDGAWELATRRGWFDGTIDEYQRARKTPRLALLDRLRSLPLQHARAVIVPSRYLATLVRGWGVPEARTSVVLNSTSHVAEIPWPLPAHDGATLLTVCRLVPWKGVGGLIDALQYLPGARLIVAGDGPLRAALEQQASDRGLAPRVTFLGNVPRGAISSLLKQATVFVLNSTYEGLPHVVLEAMAAAVPVIASDAGGTGEVVQHGRTGLLFRPGDTAALVRALRELLSDPAQAAELARRGSEAQRERFSEKACFQRTLEILDLQAANRSETR